MRPDFPLLAGNELLVSAAAIGATGMFSSLAGIAPKLVRQLYDLCRNQKLFEARDAQEEIAALRQLLKPGGVAASRPPCASWAAIAASRARPNWRSMPPLESWSASSRRLRRCAPSRGVGDRSPEKSFTRRQPAVEHQHLPGDRCRCGLAR